MAKPLSGKPAYYFTFWGRFLDRVHREHPDWTSQKAQPRYYVSMPSPIPRTAIGASFTGDGRLRHDLYINGGDREQSLEVFKALEEQRLALEGAYGHSLVFETKLARSLKACRIAEYREGDVTETESHAALVEWLLDRGVRLRKALIQIGIPA
jgi:hypothetical protein